MKDCWNTIGIRGDSSCIELHHHVHCRNCPVYSSAARSILDHEPSAAYLAKATAHIATPKTVAEAQTLALLILRVGAEWLAMPMSVVLEITKPQPVRSLPHRPPGVVLGLTNVRGELLVCVSLRRLLGLNARASGPDDALRPAQERLIVVRRDGVRIACVADEIDSIHRCRPSEIATLPATVARSGSTHSRGVTTVHGRPIGVLDEQLLFASMQRGLA